MNKLTVTALLHDTILHINCGMHSHRNFKVAKKVFCEALNISNRTTSKRLLEYLGAVYKDNGEAEEFNRVVHKFNLDDYLLSVKQMHCEVCSNEMNKEDHDFSDICPECLEELDY